ncbi:hypothetical protein LTR62_000811 [Meristemomyces frigidus]|uniref:sterol 3beta-glucosyltransferase n=1 Tax=Meristemomyces frigidus TaxID=1508187 RepID=A0AAN7YIH1_9PEZI|nr:hypothetical protein LTR62_000811 [Meristemomyces frigidus]
MPDTSQSTPSLRAKASPGIGRHRQNKMAIPDRFRGEDDEEDVTGTDRNKPDYMHKSVYGLIGAHFPSFGLDRLPGLFEADGGSDSEGQTDSEGRATKVEAPFTATQSTSARTSLEEHRPQPAQPTKQRLVGAASNKRAVVKTVRHRTGSDDEEPMIESQILPSKEPAERNERSATITSDDNSEALFLDRKLQAKARTGTHTLSASPMHQPDTDNATKAKTDPAVTVANIFQLDSHEEVIREYDCWYLMNVLLPGYMYITSKHLCFFSYLQRKGDKVLKSGHLGKQGKHNPRFRRYWFTLKGDVLTYYVDATKPYYPNGSIDLRYAESAELMLEKGQEKKEETRLFTITNNVRTHYFKADSATSAQEWVKAVQRVIFRQRNDSDSLKITLSLDNIVDVAPSPMLGLATTIRVRSIDRRQSMAVDEYFFTFNGHNGDALSTLLEMTKDNEALAFAPDQKELKRSQGIAKSPLKRVAPARTRSRESLARSDHSESDQAPSSPELGEVDIMSASQMLTGDDAFGAPTLRGPQKSESGGKLKEAEAEADFVRFSDLSTAGRGITGASLALRERTLQAEMRVNRTPKAPAQPPTRPSNATLQASAQPKLVTLATPLQYAYGLANQVSNTTTRGLSYLGSSPKEYYSRFSDALAGGKRHYSEAEGLSVEDSIDDPESHLDTSEHERRFREHFGLADSEKLVAVFYCSLHRVLPLYGKVYIGTRSFCFRSLLYGTRTKLVVPFKDILNVEKEKGYRWGYPGMVVVIRGHEEIFFDFKSNGLRDDCVVTVLRTLDDAQSEDELTALTGDEKMDADAAAAEHALLMDARGGRYGTAGTESLVFDDPSVSVMDFKPKKGMRITCLTIGSRGDVQPYIALCKGLLAEGMKPRLATHLEFKEWVEKHGIEFVPVGGDPAELMKMCVDNGMFTPSFIWKASTQFRGWLNELMNSAYDACKGSDLLIESPSAMCGIHIAEALGIPYFRAFTMPWTRTRAYPHAFAVPGTKYGGQWNQNSYAVFDTVFWAVTSGQINKWRTKKLGLPPTSLGKMQPNKVPFLYNFSPSVVIPPLDFSDWVRITGYWFLDEGQNWKPPADLQAFIDKARKEEQKLVYIGFGSVTVNDSRELTRQVVDAVRKANVRCILSKGWSDRFDKDPSAPDVMLPDSVFLIRSAPHDWLFKQIDAAVHHGGAGTTGASLRAGVPTIIKPFFGDQFFFATRVEDLGVGLHLKKVTVNALGRALWVATHDERMRRKARRLGEKIRREDGVGTAIKAIYRDLEYARSLIKRHGLQTGFTTQDDAEEIESWTFIETESDVEVSTPGLEGSGMVGPFQQQQHQQRSWGLPSVAKGKVAGQGSLVRETGR